MNSTNKVLLPVLFVVMWSSGWVVSKYAIGSSGPFTFLTLRYLLVVIVLLLWVATWRHWRKITATEFACHALIGILSHAVFTASGLMAMESGATAGLVAFITSMQPLLTATVTNLVTREQVSGRQWFGLLVGIAAVMLVIGDRIFIGHSMLVYGLPLLSVLAITIATLLDRRIELRAQHERKEPLPLSLLMLIHCSGALVVFTSIGFTRENFDVQWGPALVATLLYAALVVSIGSFGLMFLLLRYMSAVKVASLGYLTPPVTLVLAWLLLGESASAADIAGLSLAGIAVYLVYFDSAKKKKDAVRTRHRRARTINLDSASSHTLPQRLTPAAITTRDRWASELYTR